MSYRTQALILLALYLSIGLTMGLILANYLPLSWLGIAYYTLTWPWQLLCTQIESLPISPEAWTFILFDFSA